MPPFGVRGVVEGFYGTPWSHDDRLDMLTFLGARGMNAYVYAPKDDPWHRSRWREPYDAPSMRRFSELARAAAGSGVRFGFSVSPGLDVDYGSPGDRSLLLDKLGPLVDAGVTWMLLLLDDIPMRPGLAPQQADLAVWLLASLRETCPDVAVTLCPTEYVGTRPSAYLVELGARLPADVDVMWTGPTVCSPEITTRHVKGWTDALGGRAPVLWDNYPVNDATMSHSLHLGPYRGRDPALATRVQGVLCNPMSQAHASKVALATAAEFLLDPEGYDEHAAWERALCDVGGTRRGALGALARACADGPLTSPSDTEVAAAVDQFEAALGTDGWLAPATRLAEMFRAARALPGAFPAAVSGSADPLAAEVAPWAAAAGREAEAGLAAIRLVQRVRPVGRLDLDGRGEVAAPDPEAAMEAAFVMLFSWAAARTNREVVFGPRFAIYPAVVQLADGRPGLDPTLAVREDANAVDRLCRLALRAYDVWRAAPDAPLVAFAGGRELTVDLGDGDGTGRVVTGEGAQPIVVHAGTGSTRFAPGDRLPFREPRFA